VTDTRNIFRSPFQPGHGPTASSHRVLLIDESEDTRSVVRHLVGVALPDARLAVYDTMAGCPTSVTGLDRYDAILLDGRLAFTGEQPWLAQLLALPGVPSVVVMTATLADSDSDATNAVASDRWIEINRREMNVRTFAEKIRFAWQPATDLSALELSSTSVMPPEKARSMRGQDAAMSAPQAAEGRTRRAANNGTKNPDVPGYENLSEVASGGVATVYLARPTNAGADGERTAVILKVIRVENAGGNIILRRFLREFRIAAKLSHPNIVTIYERGFASDFAYIAMENCAGGDLRGRIKTQLAPELAVDYTSAIAAGLGEAHRNGVIHRDVKPANVLFRADGSIALTDFGIAKAREAAASLTMTNAMVGTPHYISPEQVRGGEVDSRADLYGLGILFYEMLTGERPFHADRLVKLLDAHVNGKIPTLPSECAQFQPIVERLLAKSPDHRFQSTDELLAALG
jgi:hypothetical protein